jgi:hypothetical protein
MGSAYATLYNHGMPGRLANMGQNILVKKKYFIGENILKQMLMRKERDQEADFFQVVKPRALMSILLLNMPFFITKHFSILKAKQS